MHDSGSDRDANLVAAAQAAASWARARRTAWTDEPLEVAGTAPAVLTAEADVDPTPAAAPSPAPVVFAPSPSQPSIAARVATLARSLGPSAVRWLAMGAAAVALGAVAFVIVQYLSKPALVPPSRTMAVEPAAVRPSAAAAAAATAAGRKATGGLHVVSTPVGATVVVDAKPRGVTPLTLTDLTPGRHEVALESDAGAVHRTVRVAANETAEMNESIFSGWLVVYAPFEVVILEGGRVLQPDGRNQIMLPPGIHELQVTNRALAFDAVRQVEVKPGEGTTLRLIPPASTLTVTATDAAEVWLDGARIGDTPLSGAPVPLGTHELVVRRGAGGERRYTVTIGANPFVLNVDFR
jgi:hypothetical protein